ncbi:MAG: OstA-like protein [Chitinophagaceae bacterium]
MPADTAAQKKIIHIIRAQRLNYKKINDTAEFQSLAGNVVMQQEKTLFYCDSAVLNKHTNILEAFGHVHINDNDSVNTYADYLRYVGNEKKAFLNKNVMLTDGKGTLTTPSLEYDLITKLGTYLQGGKLVDDKTTLISTEGYYYGETRDVIFKKKVVMIDPDYTVKTDTLLYNTYTGIATFIVPTEIVSGTKKINTTDGYYDTKNKKYYFDKRPTIQDSATLLTADEVAFDDSTGFGEARGNVIYKDTAQKTTILSNNLKSNRKENSFLATEKPVMIIKQEEDSIFIAADTLYSAKLSVLEKSRTVPLVDTSLHSKNNKQDSSKDRFIEAYYHVKIFSDSLQAVGDSLFYSAQDSVFRLFKQPIVWAQDNQITGDTIYLYTQNKKPKRMYVFENAMALSKVRSGYFNQIKGRTINGYFSNGNIDYLRTKGNAESVYYALDDNNKFIGVNKATCDVIDMYFDNKKLQKVALRNNVTGTMYPMGQVNHEDIKLRGFKWQDDRRPKSQYELFGD